VGEFLDCLLYIIMRYSWLQQEKAPRILVEAVKLIGTKEIVGPKHNPIILDWAKQLRIKAYTNDEIPWCGLFVAYCAYKANVQVVDGPLWALNWNKYGTKVDTPMLGDVLTFKRDGGGHVGIYVGEDRTHYHILGGNQSNEVNVMRIAKNRLNQARRTAWKIAQPSNVRKIELSNKGIISTNEA
jgi:uncharacterized protein (TIGR02594 family)